MSKILSAFILIFVIFSCKQEPSNNGESGGSNTELENKIKQLELDNSMKDSVINESLVFFNEIQSNLEAIGSRKDEIRAVSDNKEVSPEDKKWILEEIQNINYLRDENAGKVRQMKDQLKKNGVKIIQLEVMIESLMKDIQWKDEQISLLQSELNNLDKEYSVLFDAYQEQAVKLDQVTDAMNTVYYAYGSSKELQENKIIEKKNGFLGMGKKTELVASINDSYFTKVDAKKKTRINIEGTDIQLITYHPRSSYKLELTGNKTTIVILDASQFWKISKYLVAVID
jgi:chromosome segregation ATPase